jgi:membrane-associated phospholipid phosphatase
MGARKINFLFAFMLLIFIDGNSQNIDVNILKEINSSHITQADKSFQFISNSTTIVAIGVPLGVFIAGIAVSDSALIRNSLVSIASLAISEAFTYALKYSVNRERPFNAYPQYFMKKSDGGDPSFPSGHTSAAFSVATSLSISYPRWYVILPAYLWAGSVAYSRMHLGVHYPSDVLAGSIVGAGSAYLSFKANQWLQKKYFSKTRKNVVPLY